MYNKKFDGLMVTLASMEDIESWSHGAVDNPDTVNYRTGKPKAGGLFCESIFGPVKNFECSCGKYKWPRYKWIVCEKCNVEVTSSRTRRTRMGHVDLASPLVHAWYKNSPSGWIHQLLQLSSYEIDKILSFVKYIVVKGPDEKWKDYMKETLKSDFNIRLSELDEIYREEDEAEKNAKRKAELKELYEEKRKELSDEQVRLNWIISELERWKTVMESDWRSFFYKFSDKMEMASGPDGILKALKEIDVEKEIKRRVKEFPSIKSADAKKKSMSLIKLLINLYVSGVKPENMVLRKLPVIPPDLRPVVQLDGWRFASSDVNLFYRRVLMRNIRLKKMVQVGMPDVLKKNEIRLLQESVNNLLVWEKAGAGKSGAGNKVFKSLSDMLSWKEWIFRKNLLWKRVDYSGRSVITVGPGLKLDECGLPIYIAVKVFTPFIIGKLMEKKIVYTPKQAEKLIKDEDPIALKFLEDVIKDKYVLLNRAPTLHRLWIEAFKIKLFPWKTIRLHPLVCGSFNADFDWDQMAIHLPISDEAQKEAKELIASDKNVLKPASGDPTLSLSQDMVLWVYYLMDYFDTRRPEVNTEEEWIKDVPVSARYSSMQEAYKAYENKEIHIKDKIMILHNGEAIETTVGRVIFNMKMPEGLPYINKNMKSKDIKQLLGQVFDEYGMPTTVKLSDDVKDLWFKYSTLAAVSINILDMKIPQDKTKILKEWDQQADEIYKLFYKWYLSEDEKHRLIIDVWTDIKKRVEACLKPIIGAGNNLYTMIDSAARGSQNNVTQICGMKWLVVNPQWEIIELPIKGSFAEWLTPIEYFIAAHSWRKWKADTALRTAESGYLTRKLCDASQEVIIREEDCGSEEYITYSKENAAASGEKFFTQIYGRVLAQDVIDENGVKILDAGIMLGKWEVALIEGNDAVHEVKVRSPITCHCASGVCQKCYGMDLSSRQLVQIWIPVGIIAAQSIWEPSTQLTLNTFHTWWVAGESESDASGIDRIKQLFEVRTPKHPAIIAPFDGTIDFEETPEGWKFWLIKITSEPQKKVYIIKDGYKLTVKKWENLPKWATYAIKWKSALKIEEEWEVLSVEKDAIILWVVQQVSHKLFWLLPKKTKAWEKVYAGEILTAGAVDIQEYKRIVGDLMAQRYIIREAKRVYSDQWQSLNDKHMEIIVKQLFSKVFIEDSGDSSFIPGTYVKYEDFLKKNEELAREKKTLAKWQRMALWLTTIAKETDSWLSAASFQETIRVMVWASLRGAIDTLSDLKANVIIWRLLPIGENYRNMHWY